MLKAVKVTTNKIAGIQALGSTALWGFLPLYLAALTEFAPLDVAGFRALFSCLMLLVLTFYRKELPHIWAILFDFKKVRWLLLSSGLLLTNWLIFIYAIASHNALEGSLGYFIYPLVSVMLGWSVFKEYFNGLQKIAIALAVFAVGYLCFFYGHFPWIGLSLALTFGFYGLIHKKILIGSLLALTVETIIAVPIAFIILATQFYYFDHQLISWRGWLLIILSGPVTVIPLLLYTKAIQTLPYSLAGMFFYINPSLQFAIANLYFKEQLDLNKLLAFILVWIALAIYSVGVLLENKLRYG